MSEQIAGEFNTTPPTYDSGQKINVQLDAQGRLLVTPTIGGVAQGGVKAPSGSLSVVAAGLEYETVAAGQTAQVLGATGATGDYLSHVVFQPTALAAGTSTILDNAVVVFTYTAGTLSDLRPITVPINAFSVSGAWKITTGATMTATGFGDFT